MPWCFVSMTKYEEGWVQDNRMTSSQCTLSSGWETAKTSSVAYGLQSKWAIEWRRRRRRGGKERV